MQRAAKRLPAHKGGPLPKELEGEQLAAPAGAQPAMLGGRILFEQLLDALVCRIAEQRLRASPSEVFEGRSPLPNEPLDDGVNGGA